MTTGSVIHLMCNVQLINMALQIEKEALASPFYIEAEGFNVTRDFPTCTTEPLHLNQRQLQRLTKTDQLNHREPDSFETICGFN